VTDRDDLERVEPHPVLPSYYQSHDQRHAFVRALFDEAAPHYDRINRTFSLGSGARYRRRCLMRAGLRPGSRVADIAVGTGLVAREILAITGKARDVVGIDISAAMLAVARSKLGIPLIQGAAEQLPLADGTVDFVTMGYALRHMSNLVTAFAEFYRVLRPGGTVLLLEIGNPTKPVTRALLSAYLGGVVPLLSRWITGAAVTRTLTRYYWDTIENCVLPNIVMDAMRSGGFAEINYTADFDLFRSYSARRR
jgi:demethylmenaquinone methyltransferase / 2-methoxy-6-polyprenyl-1,4-benzoquinol methylase